MCKKQFSIQGNLNRHIRFHFMWKGDCFYVIIVLISITWLNIFQSLVMWYLSNGVLCSHHLMCHRNLQLWDAFWVTVGRHVTVQTVDASATRGGKQIAWLHTSRGHFLIEQMHMKCAQWVCTVHHRKQRELFVGFCNLILTCLFWWEGRYRYLFEEELTRFQFHELFRCVYHKKI